MLRFLTVRPLVAILWIVLILTADFWIGFNVTKQWRAAAFPTVEAVVTSSSLEYGTSRRRTSGPVIRYAYVVDGTRHEGDTFQYGNYTSSDWQWARAMVRAHPVGATTRVHYDPRNPSDSVIDPGLHGSDLFLALFLTPFNAIGLGLLFAPMARERMRASEGAGVRWRDDGEKIRVRMPRHFSPLAAGIAVFAFAAFALSILVGFSFGLHPSMSVMVGVWAVVLAAGASAATYCWLREMRGDVDLVIDKVGGAVSLPATFDRKARVAMARADVRGVEVKAYEQPGSPGTIVHGVRIVQRSGAWEVVAEREDAESAESLARWLRGKLGV
ncbi:MAG: DUF3592 domain-containing protein [Hyphomonadaceae bacterium]|nr:DUF3592 domain-containing protein [Hyphomonadaceae bacterium]